MRQFISGTFVAAAAPVAVNLPIGWQPDYFRLTNITDGNVIEEWSTGMANGTSIKTSGNGVAPNAANALSIYAGDSTAMIAKGMTVGTGSQIAGKTYAYQAMRGA